MPSNNENLTLPEDKKKRKKSENLYIGTPPSNPTKSPFDDFRTSFEFKTEGQTLRIVADDLTTICELGRGAFGVVEKVHHPETNTTMAVKRITPTQDSIKTESLLMDLRTLERSDCPFIVRFYGVMFRQGDVMICMEVMDISLDKFYKCVFSANRLMSEDVLWTISFSVLNALAYLNKELRVIHRDVKPSNMLIGRNGKVKLCDFGISGILRPGSVAHTVDAGCRYYMAPERIDPTTNKRYDQKSDTWSFGISMIEISTGSFPYERHLKDLFKQQKQILHQDAPSLPDDGRFSLTYRQFVQRALKKKVEDRPKPYQLLEDTFLKEQRHCESNIVRFVNDILDNTSAD